MPHGDKHAAYARRHHLRHQQRIRLRLPARQHGAVEGRPLPARPALRDRRRGRLDPDRRGAHAADHLRPGRRVAGAVHQGQPHRPAADPAGRRKKARATTGSTRRASRCTCPRPARNTPRSCCARPASCRRGRQPVRRAQPRRRAPPQRRAARACDLPARRRLHRARRRSDHRRRIHRPHAGRAAAGPTACTRRSRRRKACRSSARTRRSPASPSRTCSACTSKLSGMTGTADTEAYEFQSIYGLEVIVIPTHRPMVAQGPFRRGVPQPRRQVPRGGQRDPGLPTSAASRCWSAPPRSKSPSCSPSSCARPASPHEVLNAKQHEREAHIVAQAGRPGAITIATNMAGRGTDIVLGGSLEAELAALEARTAASSTKSPRRASSPSGRSATTRSRPPAACTSSAPSATRSRRIDNQLRGRSGRQGDPGSSRFYLSLEDNLMRIFAADWVQKAMARMGLKEDDVIESRAGHQADRQRAAQGRGPQLRHPQEPARLRRRQQRPAQGDLQPARRTAGSRQREGEHRRHPRATWSPRSSRASCRRTRSTSSGTCRAWKRRWQQEFGLQRAAGDDGAGSRGARRRSHRAARAGGRRRALRRARKRSSAPETMRMLEKHIMLNVLDQNWKEHLARMDYLRQGIHLRGYAQKQPKQEYKKEASSCSREMLEKVKREVVTLLARVRIRSEEEIAAMEAAGARARPRRRRGRCSSSTPTPAASAPTRKPRRRRRARPGCAPIRDGRQASAATIRARAAAARSTSTAMASWPDRGSDRLAPCGRAAGSARVVPMIGRPRPARDVPQARAARSRARRSRRRRHHATRAAASCWRAAPKAATWPALWEFPGGKREPGETRRSRARARTARRTRHRRRAAARR